MMYKILFLLSFLLFCIACGDEKSEKQKNPECSTTTEAGCFKCDRDLRCSGNHLMSCNNTSWSLSQDCALIGKVCETIDETSAICIDPENIATKLLLIPRSTRLVTPAGIRTVFTVVKDNGLPPEKLSVDDFNMINDHTGKPFSEGGGAPNIAPANNIKFHTILVLDMSASIFDAGVADQVGEAAKEFIKTMVTDQKGVRKHYVALYAFGSTSESELIQNFTTDDTLLSSKIDEIIARGSRGGTNLYGAYKNALNLLDSVKAEGSAVIPSLILLSDGTDEAGVITEAEALTAKDESDAEIYTIGIKGDYDQHKIKRLATRDNNFFSSTISELTATFRNITELALLVSDSNYVIGLCSPVEGASSFTVQATKEGLTGEIQIQYDGREISGWTGDISKCDEKILADPCGSRECGESALSGINCGSCGGTNYCSEDQICIPSCIEMECGYDHGISCGSCNDAQYCNTLNRCKELPESVDYSAAMNLYGGFYNAPNYPNSFAFIAQREDGSLTAWGSRGSGANGIPTGNNYLQITSTIQAFAALKSDGSITAWGYKDAGGEGAPADKGYTQIYSNWIAFAALKEDGSITAWGDEAFGGSGAPVDGGYVKIFSNDLAFAALKEDGSITAWGCYNDDCSSSDVTIPPTDNDYVKIYSTNNAFAALKADGSITTWGDTKNGGSGAPADKGYTQIYSNWTAFAALKEDGTITTWGDGNGENTPTDKGYINIYSTHFAFAALKKDGSITVWGSKGSGGSGAPTDKDYINISSTGSAFAALKRDGSITAWGNSYNGGSGAPTDNGYTKIYSNDFAFAALREDGSITAWGYAKYGGSGAPVDNGYVKIYATGSAFAALKRDGTITVWGAEDSGGGDDAPSGAGYTIPYGEQ